jgi:hypothetical protein
MPDTTSPYERLDSILRGSEGDSIRSHDQYISSRRPSEIGVILTSRSSRMASIGPLITTTDRELRRAVTIFRSGSYNLGMPGNRPRPISANYGGLEITNVAVGSFHMLLTAYGEVLSLLTSTPTQAFTAVLTMGQSFGSIRLWTRRKKDSLEGMSARQALDVVRQFGGDPTRLMQGEPPSLEIEIQGAEEEGEPFTHPEMSAGERNIHIPLASIEVDRVNRYGEIVAQGRRITYIRNYPDGTQDVIYVDG